MASTVAVNLMKHAMVSNGALIDSAGRHRTAPPLGPGKFLIRLLGANASECEVTLLRAGCSNAFAHGATLAAENVPRLDQSSTRKHFGHWYTIEDPLSGSTRPHDACSVKSKALYPI